jgi:hypothetical protein
MIGAILAGAYGDVAPVGDFESIATVTVGSGGSSEALFSSIPSTFQHLQLRIFYRNEGATTSRMRLRLNGDTGNNYSIHVVLGDGSSASSSAAASASYTLGIGPSVSGNSGWAVAVVDLLDYTNTNKNTTLRALNGVDQNGSGEVGLWSGAWYNTAAVNSIRLFMDSAEDIGEFSKIALYGIRG